MLLQLGVYVVDELERQSVFLHDLAGGLHFPAGQLVLIGEEGVGVLCRGIHTGEIDTLALAENSVRVSALSHNVDHSLRLIASFSNGHADTSTAPVMVNIPFTADDYKIQPVDGDIFCYKTT